MTDCKFVKSEITQGKLHEYCQNQAMLEKNKPNDDGKPLICIGTARCRDAIGTNSGVKKSITKIKYPIKILAIAAAVIVVLAGVFLYISIFSGKAVYDKEDVHDNEDVYASEDIHVGDDVYACGNVDYKAVYWKNGEVVELSSQVSSARSIYVSGNDVYVCGSIYSYPSSKTGYWKNGEFVEFFSQNSITHSIYVSGNDVYVCGDVDNKAVYWKNGEIIELSSQNSITHSIYVSGNDVYVCGWVRKKTGYQQERNSAIDEFATLLFGSIAKAVYWKNGELVELSNSYGDAWSIYVSGNDVYVCGWIGEYPEDKAVYWENGELIELSNSSSGSGEALSIYVSGNDVYVLTGRSIYKNRNYFAGLDGATKSIYVSDNDIYVGGERYYDKSAVWKAVIWKNGEKMSLSDTGISSDITGVFVVKNN